MRSGRTRGEHGFTIIELVMVIAVIGLLAALAVPAFQDMAQIRRETARQKMIQDIRYARSLAIAQMERIGVTLSPSTESYSVYRNDSSNIVTNPADRKPFTVNFQTEPAFRGVAIESTSLSGNVVEFDSYGTPSDAAGEFNPNTIHNIVLSGGQGPLTTTIKIFPETGMVQ